MNLLILIRYIFRFNFILFVFFFFFSAFSRTPVRSLSVPCIVSHGGISSWSRTQSNFSLDCVCPNPNLIYPSITFILFLYFFSPELDAVTFLPSEMRCHQFRSTFSLAFSFFYFPYLNMAWKTFYTHSYSWLFKFSSGKTTRWIKCSNYYILLSAPLRISFGQPFLKLKRAKNNNTTPQISFRRYLC